MDSEVMSALASYLIALGDDELILSQRDSEWCGHAPILEEDIAFANLALDELGHAVLNYALAADLLGEDSESYPDRLAFWREAEEFRNIQMVELPRGDWAFSMLRQFLFDSAEAVRTKALEGSTFPPLAAASAKIRKEELYHQRHTRAWVLRLGRGTEESHLRLQNALDGLWPYTGQMFTPLPQESILVDAGVIPPADNLAGAWEELVYPLLQEAGLVQPAVPPLELSRTDHQAELKWLIEEMQSTARLEPGAGW